MSILRFSRKIPKYSLSEVMNRMSPVPNTFLLGNPASPYASFSRSHPLPQIRETAESHTRFTERHLHCVWADHRLRPPLLRTARGEELQILHPGDWNQGAGPDFRNAQWRVGGRQFQGDVELHLHPMDWIHHGHEKDPHYREVRLHVSYHPGELPVGALPKGCEEVALKAELDRRSHFFFESIDVSAYPWDRDSTPSGLRAWFQSQEDPICIQMLESAGLERLRRKTQRMLNLIRSVGTDQALYQTLMRGLGYYRNAEAAEQLAVQLPLTRLRHHTQGDPFRGYAALLGCSGLLPYEKAGPMFPPWFPLRSLWDQWWRMRDAIGETAGAGNDWRMDQCRPGNHPARRLWAAAYWFRQGQDPGETWSPQQEESESGWIRRCTSLLQVPPPPSAPDEPNIVGPARSASLFINAVLPWRLAICAPPEEVNWASSLPLEPLNHRARKAAHTFLGRDAHPRIYSGTLQRQGLLQLAEDYGL